jgi:hypothetical protein
MVLSLVQVTEQDPTLFICSFDNSFFSRDSSMNEDESLLNDSLTVNRTQFYYAKLLWKYLIIVSKVKCKPGDILLS